jgi:hypothetical protein
MSKAGTARVTATRAELVNTVPPGRAAAWRQPRDRCSPTEDEIDPEHAKLHRTDHPQLWTGPEEALGSVHVIRDGVDDEVPYWTTGVFGLEGDRRRWLYWGGSEPQQSPKV